MQKTIRLNCDHPINSIAANKDRSILAVGSRQCNLHYSL